jgi:hypothetical protein
MNTHLNDDDAIEIADLETCAIIISGYVSQGRIGPVHADDMGAETLLAQLSLLVLAQEPPLHSAS